MNKLLCVAAVLAANNVAQAQEYERFANAAARYGYTWEPVEVTTEDDHILTVFHITGNDEKTFEPTMPPVLVMHGDYGDSVDWFTSPNESGLPPMVLRLAEAGYDVWIGNNRGTEYSQQHVSLTTEDAAFWAWSWGEMGLYDDVAFIKEMKVRSGAEKVFYLGYSQGTVQMFYGLAHRHDDFYADNLHKFLAFAPCTVCPKDGQLSWWENNLFAFPQSGIHDMYGPDWKEENEATVCSEFGNSACNWVNCDTCQAVAVQSEVHWYQNTYANNGKGRFQEYSPGWLEGDKEAPLVPLENIKNVEVAMLVAGADQTCPLAAAEEARDAIGDAVTHFQVFEGKGHGWFDTQNSDWWMDIVTTQLQVPDSDGGNDGDDDEATEVIGGAAEQIKSCEDGCTECHDAWMSNDENNVYQVCTDWTVYKYTNPCTKNWQNKDACNTDGWEPCLMSYDFSDSKKMKSDTKGCRTVPQTLRNDWDNAPFKWSKKKQKNNKKGICDYMYWEGCTNCRLSYFKDTSVEPNKWRGYSAMNRCM